MSTVQLVEQSKKSIEKGSKSFYLASLVFSREIQSDVFHLYSWCRYCDDVTDGSELGFHQNLEGLSQDRVQRLILRSRQAIEETSSLAVNDPLRVLDEDAPLVAFGEVMRKYQIPWQYAHDLLEGMSHDARGVKISDVSDLLLYCYQVAGTVGLMMCHIMGLKDERALKQAVDLGIALQLTNIARDVGDDYRVGKVYLPRTWLDEARVSEETLMHPGHSPKRAEISKRLLDYADQYYASGLKGLSHLPWRSAIAVSIAASVYRRIGAQVLALGPRAWESRVVVSPTQKILAVVTGLYQFLKTAPRRIFVPKRVQPIRKIWRYDHGIPS